LEKLANNLNNLKKLKTYTLNFFLILLLLSSIHLSAQAPVVEEGKVYKIENITTSGNTNYGSQTIIAFSGLRKGKEIILPASKEIGDAIKKLWASKLFSSVDIFITKIENDAISLEIELTDLPQLEELTITGVKKSKFKDIIQENKLQTGTKVTENLITTTKNYLENKYREKGFLNARVRIKTSEVQDSIDIRRINMDLSINKGSKIKIKNIVFTGNEKLSSKKLRKAMKNTKRKNFIRVLKRSKYIEDNFKEDLVNIVNKYKEQGYRDARIISDTLIRNPDNTISLNIDLVEGEKYVYGDIQFLGNTVYSDEQLNQILKIKKGDTYNGVELQKRIQDNSQPNANDLTNAYQNTGYLFSRIIPVETKTEGNVIDMEIRIIEGKPAYINNVTITGNDVTNDRVIYRDNYSIELILYVLKEN